MPPIQSKPVLHSEQMVWTNPELFEALKERAEDDTRVGKALHVILKSPPRIPEQPSHMVFVENPVHHYTNISEARIVVPAPGGKAYLVIRVPTQAFYDWDNCGYKPELLCQNIQALIRRASTSIWEALTTGEQREVLLAAMTPISKRFINNPQCFRHEVIPTLCEALGVNGRLSTSTYHLKKDTAKFTSHDVRAFKDSKANLQEKLDKLVQEVQVVSSALSKFGMDEDFEVDQKMAVSTDQDTSEVADHWGGGVRDARANPICSKAAPTHSVRFGGTPKPAHSIVTPTTSDDGWGASPKGPYSNIRTPVFMSGARCGNPSDPFVDTETQSMPGVWFDEPLDDHVQANLATRGKNKGKQGSSWLFGGPRGGWFGSGQKEQSNVSSDTKRAGAKDKAVSSRKAPEWSDPSGATHWVSNPYIPPRTCSIYNTRVNWDDDIDANQSLSDWW